MPSFSDTCADLLLCLHDRLLAVEQLLQYDGTPGSTPDASPIVARLEELQGRLALLTSNNPAAAGLLQLYAKHPQSSKQKDERSTHTEQLPILLSSATSFSTTVSNLNDMQNYPIPDAQILRTLLALQPRLTRAQSVQGAQEAELAELRQRSAAALAHWYSRTVLEGGEQWSTWEERMMKMEQKVRREEAALRREA